MQLDAINFPNSDSAKRWSVTAVVIALFLAAMDSTAVAVLLPRIGHSLGQPAFYAWIMSGYLLAVTLVAPFAGTLGDRFGERSMLQLAVVLFAIASVGSALAPSMVVLIPMRILQGLGGGMIIVLAYALLGTLYGAKRRGSMQGMLSSVWGVAAVLGPLLGAGVAAWLGWRFVFWLNLPLALVCLAILHLADQDRPLAKHPVRIDIGTQLLLGIATVCGMLALSQPVLHLTLFSLYALLGAMFLAVLALVLHVHHRHGAAPIPSAFFVHRDLFASLVLLFLSSGGLYGSVTLLPLYLERHGGAKLFDSAGAVALAAVGWSVGSALCGKVLERAGYRLTAFFGASLLLAGSVLLLLDTTNLGIYAAEVLLGFGIGFIATTALVLAQNCAPAGHIGAYTAATQFLRNLGAAVGINTLAAVHLASFSPASNAYRDTFLVFGVAMALSLPLALMLPSRYLGGTTVEA